jgi:hypothetical protein
MESEWTSAALLSDSDKYETLLADEFTFVMHGGRLMSRAEFLASVRGGNRRIRSIVNNDFHLRLYGHTAIIVYTQTLDADFFGKAFKGESTITKVWIKTEGKWLAAAFHASDSRLASKWDRLARR